MNPLMETLLGLLKIPQTDAKARLSAAGQDVIEAAEKRLTYEELENLWDAFFDIEKTDDLNSFILGFRLGVQLTVEGLRPIALN